MDSNILPIESLNKYILSNQLVETKLFIDNSSIVSIVEATKNCLLEWTLKLEEKGILGEDMKFTSAESQKAQTVPQQVNNYFNSNVVNGNVSESQFAGNSSPITVNNNGIDLNEFETLAKTVTDNISLLNRENQETVLDCIDLLREELSKKQPKKSILNSGIKMLAPVITTINGIPNLPENIQKIVEFIKTVIPSLPM